MTAWPLVHVASLTAAAATAGGTPMECGARVNVCGIITLESGLGDGVYAHKEPSVHGLWPEVGTYGTSSCIAPSQSTADPTRVYSCYECVDGARPVPPPPRNIAFTFASPPLRPSLPVLLPAFSSPSSPAASPARRPRDSSRLKRTSGGSTAFARE